MQMKEIRKYTIPTLLQGSVERFSERTSLAFVGEQGYTFRDLGAEVARVGGLLRELGVEKGDKVALLSSNMPNWGVAFFSISWAGATAVPILPDFHANEIKFILAHSEAKVLFVSESSYRGLKNETSGLPEHLILLENFAVFNPE